MDGLGHVVGCTGTGPTEVLEMMGVVVVQGVLEGTSYEDQSSLVDSPEPQSWESP